MAAEIRLLETFHDENKGFNLQKQVFRYLEYTFSILDPRILPARFYEFNAEVFDTAANAAAQLEGYESIDDLVEKRRQEMAQGDHAEAVERIKRRYTAETRSDEEWKELAVLQDVFGSYLRSFCAILYNEKGTAQESTDDGKFLASTRKKTSEYFGGDNWASYPFDPNGSIREKFEQLDKVVEERFGNVFPVANSPANLAKTNSGEDDQDGAKDERVAELPPFFSYNSHLEIMVNHSFKLLVCIELKEHAGITVDGVVRIIPQITIRVADREKDRGMDACNYVMGLLKQIAHKYYAPFDEQEKSFEKKMGIYRQQQKN